MKAQNEIQSVSKTPWGIIILAMIICAFLYAMNSIFASNSDEISPYATVFFLLSCLFATLVAFTGRFGNIYRVSIVIFTCICVFITLRGIIYKRPCSCFKRLDALIDNKNYDKNSNLKVIDE